MTSDGGEIATSERIGAGYRQGRATFPTIALSEDAFRAHVDRLCRDHPKFVERFERAHFSDLFLAFACLERDQTAIHIFTRKHVDAALAYLKRTGVASEPADVLQELTQQLFGLGASAPKLLLYSGLGALGAFVRVAALRLARTDARRRERLRENEYDDHLAATANPERLLMKREHAEGTFDAIRAALADLEPLQRDLLRAYYYESHSLEQIAARLNVSRATAARRIAATREEVLRNTRSHAQRANGARAQDVDSLLRLTSSLDLGLSRLLGPERSE